MNRPRAEDTAGFQLQPPAAENVHGNDATLEPSGAGGRMGPGDAPSALSEENI